MFGSMDAAQAMDAAANMSRFSGSSAREAQDDLDHTWQGASKGRQGKARCQHEMPMFGSRKRKIEQQVYSKRLEDVLGDSKT